MASTEMQTRKVVSFPTRNDSQIPASDTNNNLDFGTNLSLKCYAPTEAQAEGVSSFTPDMLELKLGQMSIPELDGSTSVGPGNTEYSQITQSLVAATRTGLHPRTVGPPPNLRRPPRARVNHTPAQLPDKGKRVIDGPEPADSDLDRELDEIILHHQHALRRGTFVPPSKMLKLSLPEPELTLAAPKPIKPLGNLEPPTSPAPNNLVVAAFSGSEMPSMEKLHLHEKEVVLDEAENEALKKASYERSDLLPWMRRWFHDQSAAPQTKPPEKLALPGNPEKQLPSLAAMALTAKAVKGFKPGGYKTKGSVTVWK